MSRSGAKCPITFKKVDMVKQGELNDDVTVFLVEGFEILDRVEQNLVELEKVPDNDVLVAEIFRDLHTLKGNSGMLSFRKIEDLAHLTENLFDQIRSGKRMYSTSIADTMLKFVDSVRAILKSIELSEPENNDLSELNEELEKLAAQEA